MVFLLSDFVFLYDVIVFEIMLNIEMMFIVDLDLDKFIKF